jgi:hypothetical protein
MNKNNNHLKGGTLNALLDPFSVPTVSVSNNFNKANALSDPTTMGFQQGISTATEKVSNDLHAVEQDTQKAAAQMNSQVEKSKGFISEIIGETTNAVANIEAGLLTAEVDVAATGASAVVAAVDKTIKNQGPKLMNTVKTATDFVFDGLNIFKKAKVQANAEADIAALKIDEVAKASQIAILMENDSNLTKEAAEAEFDILETERKEKEEAAAAAVVALEIAKAATPAAGGSRKKSITLGQIQKGGRQSAKRTKKSINDFFNSSVTSSQILKMITNTNTNRNTKVKRKRKRNSRISRRSRK